MDDSWLSNAKPKQHAPLVAKDSRDMARIRKSSMGMGSTGKSTGTKNAVNTIFGSGKTYGK